MGLSKGEVVFYRLKIRSETTNVAKFMKKKLRKVSRCFGSPPREQSNLGTFIVPSPEWDSKAGLGVTILNSE
ncbi:hypothetical protein E2C01_099971 [Portunus trituberculatus]|uniref:Uncharacterized protein n=1 Tax=Portunus trituberculatus TaxID=210409 RepID=A0A5B7K1R6_PORTR|nr:hypothetical protein [Portunus trituberculatus]